MFAHGGVSPAVPPVFSSLDEPATLSRLSRARRGARALNNRVVEIPKMRSIGVGIPKRTSFAGALVPLKQFHI